MSETEIMLADFGLSEEFNKNKELIFKRYLKIYLNLVKMWNPGVCSARNIK